MASPLANLILAEGPRFYYNCDEAAGATLTDQTGNGRNGAVVGSFSRSTALQGAGKGIDLAVGAGNYIQGHHGWSANGIKNAAAGNPGLTIHCLAKFPANYDLATQANPNFMCAGQTTSGSGAGPIFRILGSQSKWDYLLGLVSDQGTVGATPFPFDGNWHQYVIQIFGQNSEQGQFYVDGVRWGGFIPGNLDPGAINTEPMCFGANTNNGSPAGYISENKAWSVDEMFITETLVPLPNLQAIWTQAQTTYSNQISMDLDASTVVTAGYTKTQRNRYDKLLGIEYITEFSKLITPAGRDPIAFGAVGSSYVSFTLSDSQALAALNAKRRHRYQGTPGAPDGASSARFLDGTLPIIDQT